jgi:hypothetical protein
MPAIRSFIIVSRDRNTITPFDYMTTISPIQARGQQTSGWRAGKLDAHARKAPMK